MERSRIEDGRVQLERSDDEKRPISQRLSRIEGQVRGLRTMIEENRYCLDEVQQIKAISSALREVALIIVAQHVAEGVRIAARSGDDEAPVEDVMRVLRSALRISG